MSRRAPLFAFARRTACWTACLIVLGGAGSLVAQEPETAPPATAPAETVQATPATPTPPPTGAADPGAAAQANPAPPPGPAVPTTTPAPAVPPPPPGPPGAGPDRIDFDLKFPTDKGGGATSGSAESLEYQREDYAVLSGEVHLRYQDIEIQADTAEIDLTSKKVIALGNVILDQGPRRLSGKSLEFDLGTKTGTMAEAQAQVTPDYFFTGTRISKIGDALYTIENGIFTSCNQKVPDWSFKVRHAKIEIEGYAHASHATMRTKKLPIFYTPYILWPVKRERSSGFLVPNFGYSDRRGSLIGLAYFLELGRSYDTTFHVDPYSKGFLGIGDEFRYRPSEGTQGVFQGYAVRDPDALPDENEWRWKINWNHEMNKLPGGLRAVVAYEDFSDFNFFRDFERDFDRNSFRFQDSRAFLAGNWGPQALNVLLNDRKTFVGTGQFVTQRKLPEIDYSLRSTRIGKLPLYLQAQNSVSYLDLERPGSYSGQYSRVDLFPQLTVPVRAFPWLSLSATVGDRITWYGDTINPLTQKFTGETEVRDLPSASGQIVGPSVSKIFNAKVGSLTKFKHIIEPRITYTYFGEYDNTAVIPLFDEVDSSFSQNVARVALVNRVLGKSEDLKDPGAREVFYLEIAQAFSLDDKQPLQISPTDPLHVNTTEGPLEALLRLNPSKGFNAKIDLSYNTLFKQLQSRSFTGGLDWKGGNSVDLTWFTNYLPQTGETVGDQARITTGLNVIPRKLRIEAQIAYDIDREDLQHQRYVASWTSQCWGLRLEVRDQSVGELRNRDYRLSISLKNVGTFLDMTGRNYATDALDQ
ncbi:MAG TPA: LPS assembly protein LptD [Thermoanaerobaculia bacterium]|jgi:LPS-assembly protein|nr:LPS assembly protein LptD [Thermoanaerobaculia bacterium]